MYKGCIYICEYLFDCNDITCSYTPDNNLFSCIAWFTYTAICKIRLMSGKYSEPIIKF